MNRAESTAIGFVVGILCPASLFVFLWWSAAALAIYRVLPIPDSGVAVAAFTGFGIGIVLDVLCLKNWIARFYHVSIKLMALAYLFWSAIAVAFFMGLPCGNVVLGTLAGLYVGRKQHHIGASREMFARAARNVSLFTALVTSAEVLPIGLLGLHEDVIIEALRAIAKLDQSVVTGPLGIGLVGIGCVVLMIVQFCCTRTATALAFRSGKNVA